MDQSSQPLNPSGIPFAENEPYLWLKLRSGKEYAYHLNDAADKPDPRDIVQVGLRTHH